MTTSMRELRSWIFLGLGLLLAGLTGLALYGVSQEYGTRQASAGSDTVEVVVARSDIGPRTVLAAEHVMSKTFPRDLVPTGALTSQEDALGQTTLATIPTGGPIVRGQLASASGASGASVTLEKGKALVAFPTTDPLTTAGLVNVGDRVDILATLSPSADAAKKTQTIVQNLEVVDVLLADRETRSVASLTFIVDHQVALVLKHLRDTQAIIDIAVRSRAQSEAAATTAVDLAYILQTYGIRK
ncbi:MAG: Flp pilus assembly protein CpaB [Candidatus Limnocylindria bacterium]